MKVTIINYGLSNLLSVGRAVEALGHEPAVTDETSRVRDARCLLLPGVGAFADGMAGLCRHGLLAPIWGCAESGVPILGICLSMQMLFEASREFGSHRGLGLLPGFVEKIPGEDTAGRAQRVPHVGWEGLYNPADLLERPGDPALVAATPFASPLLDSITPGEEAYFVHSFEAKPQNPAHMLAACHYGGRCAAAGRDTIFGTQFHPEKSGGVGLRLLRRFLSLAKNQLGTS